MEQIGLKQYLSIVLKRFWVIIVTTMALIAITVVIINNIPKTYESKAIIYVGNNSANKTLDVQDLLYAKMLMRDYMVLIRTNSVITDVASGLKENFEDYKAVSKYDIWKKVNIRSEYDSQFLCITVKDSNPQVATYLANRVVNVFKEKVEELMQVKNITIVEPGEISDMPSSVNAPSIFVTVFILGIILGVIIISMMEYMDSTFRSSEDVNRYLGFEVLGQVPDNPKTSLDDLSKSLFENSVEQYINHRFPLID